MDWKRALRWSGEYFLLASLSTVLGLGLVVAGVLVGGAEAYVAVRGPGRLGDALDAGLAWLALTLAGVLVWRFGAAVALHRTLTGAVEGQLAATYSTERVKSEVLEVLDERLVEMQGDIQSLEFALERAERSGDPGDFEFGVDGGERGDPGEAAESEDQFGSR